MPGRDFYRRCGKRLFDVTVAAAAIVILSPLMGAAALGVRQRLGRPVIFRQQRGGRNGDPIVVFKFRTMLDEDAAAGKTDAERLTPFGSWLRRWSVDELPTLFNVLRGDMSLVGPRPLLLHYGPLYTEEQRRRLLVHPGITGWAQIHGRNRVAWEQRFAHDVWYVDHVGFLLDLRILLGTVTQVIGGAGIAADGHATMPPYTGPSPE